MIQIPDNVRPYLDAVLKHHFWILLPLVPLAALPMVFVARGKLAAEIDAARGQIKSRLDAVKGVQGIQPHPNDAWTGEIDKATRRVKRETLAEWQRFWASQQPLRVWPASLGADFVQRVTALKPGARLPRPLLERYQNGVRALVRTLPARMSAEELMVDRAGGAPGMPPGMPAGMLDPGMPRGRPAAAGTPATVTQWNAADQQRLYASFNWDKPPSTLQVVLAQEELWVYGVLADAIARANKSATGGFNAAVPLVEQLAVGYPAAEENPGAVGGARLVVPAAGQGSPPGPMGDFMPPPDSGMPPGGGTGRPPHPRFGAGGPGGMPPPGGEPPPGGPAAADDLLRNWIYVDFSGKPLTAAELTASPDARQVHLVPFVIRAVVDERRLDALLGELATAPVPVDVRQVRINAGGLPMTGPGEGFAGPGGRPAAGGRPHDVMVELRGSVGLATMPDPQALGLDAAVEQEAAAGEPAAANDAGGQP